MGTFVDLSVLAVRHAATTAAAASKVTGAAQAVDAVANFLGRHFTNHSGQLTAALAKANDRAWKALELALAGDGLWDQARGLLAGGDAKAVRDHARAFLATVAAPHLPSDPGFRADCLRELRAARKAGLLADGPLDVADLSRRVGVFAGLVDGPAVAAAEWRVLDRVADQFPADRYPRLKRLLAQRAGGGPPLLAVAVRYFFRVELQADANQELFRGWTFDALGRIEQDQRHGFDAFGDLLARHGDALDRLLGLAEAAALTHAVALDIRDEQRRQHGQAGAIYDEVIGLGVRLDLLTTKLRPQDSLSIRSDVERGLVRSLLQQFRAWPADRQREAPALLNGLGKLQFGAGDFAAARQAFAEVADAVPHDDVARAEAHHNAYRAALEDRDWDAALFALSRCVELAPDRFAPFPFDRYEPEAILGAGAFGTAFRCRHRRLNCKVVVKALNVSELQRDVDDLFREAQVLEELNHPGIIRVRDADYAGKGRDRPYLVMDWFDGTDLEQYVRRYGPLSGTVGLDFARQLAEAVAAAHARGLLHRDLKPSNVLMWVDGTKVRLKLIDFGLALRGDAVRMYDGTAAAGKTLLGSSVAGSLDYAAPEQMGKLPGVSVGPYSDVYGWARTVCWALFEEPHPLPSQFRVIPSAFADLLEVCMAKDPKKRHSDFAAVLGRLRAVDAPPAAPTAAPVPAPRPASVAVVRPGPAAAAPRPVPTREFSNMLGMKFVPIEPGKFLMGSPETEAERLEHETPHRVKISRPFLMGIHEVTQGQWKAVMGNNPSRFQGDTLPVEQVSWEDVAAFCKKLSEKESKPYRLPTEAEWEYACRAGTTTPFQTGETISTEQANYDGRYVYGRGVKGKYRVRTTPVGSFKPNAWGLFDMHGNVWEWCADAYAEYPPGEAVDPTGPSVLPQNASRVLLRGGSFGDKPSECRSAYRVGLVPGRREVLIGFRVVLGAERGAGALPTLL